MVIDPSPNGSWRLRDRQSLLVLDNFEHVLPAATFVADLLGACPRSRSSLPVAPRWTSPASIVSGAAPALPDPAATATSEAASRRAVRLFVTRAQAAQPGFALTDQNAAW